MAESIQVIVPNYEEDAEANEALFWAAVAADPKMVVVVMAVIDDITDDRDDDRSAVFSTRDRAVEHAKAMTCSGAILVPMRIDEPSWGDVTVN